YLSKRLTPYSNEFRCDNGGNNRKERYFPNDINRTTKENKPKRYRRLSWFSEARYIRTTTNTNSELPQRGSNTNRPKHISSCDARGYERADWENFPTQPPICSGNDGLSARLDGITFPKWRNESIKAYGNAVVPSLVYEIFKVIEQYEQINK
ncbi:hypothetical protein KA005_70215, partial [bacterium]|nr:hypothetical protein [bacterium]